MAAPPLVIGIDAGGTATRVVAARGTRRISVRGGTGNLLTLGERKFLRLLRQCARDVAEVTARSPQQVRAVCLGGAGLGRTREREQALAHLTAVWPHARASVTDDATIFLWAVFGSHPGAVLMAGTGSICVGRDAHGRSERAGGWGSLLGDAGSAFALGQDALAHALSARDGLTKATPFSRALVEHLKVSDALNVLSLVYDPDAGGPATIAALAPVVLGCARRGDPVAARIVTAQSRALARVGSSVVKRLGSSVTEVALGGGLFRTRWYAAAVRQELARTCPNVRVFASRKDPVYGAVTLAQKLVTHG
jgi:N-acetylglucosamine kinase-like BadF-type ATPase